MFSLYLSFTVHYDYMEISRFTPVFIYPYEFFCTVIICSFSILTNCRLFDSDAQAIQLGPVYMEWGTPVYWGKFLLFSRSGGHKTKETYPTRPGSPTPCKQGLRLVVPTENDTFQDNASKLFNNLPETIRNCKDYRTFLRLSRNYVNAASTFKCINNLI